VRKESDVNTTSTLSPSISILATLAIHTKDLTNNIGTMINYPSMILSSQSAASLNVYADCLAIVANANNSNTTTTTSGTTDTDTNALMLECITKFLVFEDAKDRLFTRTSTLVYSAAMVFFMQAGFAMLCAGSVRKKNVQNTMLKNLLDACGASVAFYSIGYAFAFGDNANNPNGFIGTTNFFLMGVDDLAFWLFQYAFSAASATIVAGTLAERCQMAAVRRIYYCT
jgi:hypothetical protein